MGEKSKLKIVFAGGGTGGHIFPGIAVADELKELASQSSVPLEIIWIGNKKGMDYSIIEKNLISNGGSISSFYGIPCGKLRRYFSLQNFIDLFRIFFGFVKSFFILKKLKPAFLFSKGGFVSVSPCFACKLLKIPYFTHECDFTPGLATRLNSKGAKNILVSYSDTLKFFGEKFSNKCLVTGNPVRPVFYKDLSAEGLNFLSVPENHDKLILLVLGGSLGASQINKLVVENLDWLTQNFIVVHQMGQAFAKENPELFTMNNKNYKPYDFISKEMASVLLCSDIVLSRSGANSICECAVASKPMLLIPLCGNGTRGDQVDNAKYFEEKGAAFVLIGNENVTSENLKLKLECMKDEKVRASLSSSCKKICGDERSSLKIAKLIFKEIIK